MAVLEEVLEEVLVAVLMMVLMTVLLLAFEKAAMKGAVMLVMSSVSSVLLEHEIDLCTGTFFF